LNHTIFDQNFYFGHGKYGTFFPLKLDQISNPNPLNIKNKQDEMIDLNTFKKQAIEMKTTKLSILGLTTIQITKQ
jgi:hypothetical protein